MSESSDDPARRLDRLEALADIQQLAAHYSVAVDGRDLDAIVALFVEDVDCGRRGSGRNALRGFYDEALRRFYRSWHQICGHAITLVSPDRAEGTVYCRAEHEDGDAWVGMAIAYSDRYERRGGRWLFRDRQLRHWYTADAQARPGQPGWDAWPGKPATSASAARLPHAFEHWSEFWARSTPDDIARLTKSP